LLKFLPKEKPSSSVQPPARSAGIEGTGTGFQIDEEEERLAVANTAQMEELLEETLRRRLRRSKQLVGDSESILDSSI
jgi:hypothetical protein